MDLVKNDFSQKVEITQPHEQFKLQVYAQNEAHLTRGVLINSAFKMDFHDFYNSSGHTVSMSSIHQYF